MKVPGDLLNGLSGDKRRGLTVLSLAAMVVAGISGIVWGFIGVLIPEKITGCNVDYSQPKCTINKQPPGAIATPADFECRACGGG